jgi:hypothetical protein
MRRRFAIFSVIGATLAALAVGGIGVLSASGQEPPNQTVTLCHATDDVKMPYVTITVDENAIANVILGQNGHATHTGPLVTSEAEAQALKDQHIMWGDIIPEFHIGANNFAGLNNTPAGLAILANDCQFVTPTPPTQAPPETKPPVTAAPPTTAAAPKVTPTAPAPVAAAPRVTG